MRPTARTRSWLVHCSGQRVPEPQRSRAARRHVALSKPRPTASKRRPVRPPRSRGTRARRDGSHSVDRHADSELPGRVGTLRAEPSIPSLTKNPWSGRPAAARVHRRTPQMPRAPELQPGPGRAGPGPARARPATGAPTERKQARHVPSKTGTLAGGPARKAKGGVQGFCGRGGRGRAEERRPRIACASRGASVAW
jgi:hypothetical protein